ncbi:MAG: hypothetical protein ACRD01_05420 [Terriglobales bacterium]
MKKTLSLATLVATFGFITLCFAAPTTVRGYIMDAKCAATHKTAMKGNVKCATSCVDGGSAAVLVEDGRAGKVIQIANQDSVKDVLGKHVALTGTVTGDSINVDSAKALPARKRKASSK